MITSADIAKKCGVSRATVSRYFNNPEKVAKKSREKVDNAIKELNYIPNLYASSLKRGRTKTIGMIIPDIENPFYIEIAYRLQKKLKEKGYNLIIQISNENMDEEFECIDFMMSNRVECLLFSPFAENQAVLSKKKFYNRYLLQMFRKPYNSFSSVYIDDVKGGYIATEELLKSGHKKILLLENISASENVESSRKKGYLAAYADYGVSADESLYLAFDSFGADAEMIENALLNSGATAAIVVAYNLQRQFLETAQRLGIKIYDDISVVFYDATPYSVQYDVTTVTHQFEDVAEKLAQAIYRRVEGDDLSAVSEEIVPYLKSGKSVKRLG